MVKRRRLNINKGRPDRSPARGDELVFARDRFKGALQDLLPRSDDDSDSASDDDTWAKSKRHPKKKIQNDKVNDDKLQQPFVMKLFDRSVDLAQFTENTPLYVICRAWMANQPHQTYIINVPPPKRPRTPEIKEEPMSPLKDDEPIKDTYWLPPPDGCEVVEENSRIPPRVERVTDFPEMFEEDEGTEPPSREDLLEDNRKHWHKVRESWHEASRRNEERYTRSLKTLVNIFKKAQRQQAA